MKRMLYVVFIVVILAGMTDTSTQAATAKRGDVYVGPFRSGDSALQCEYIGRVTIKQIYEKGSRAVHIQDDKSAATYVMSVIEGQQ